MDMNTRMRVHLGILFMVLVFQPAFAGAAEEEAMKAAETTEAAAAIAAEPQVSSLSGAVVAVNVEDQTLVIQYAGEADDTQTVLILVGEEAKITKGSEAQTLASLKEGDKVAVSYKKDEWENMVAQTISIED